jgi:[NiFe] hydrogenase assembly HybE family chaperone
MSPTPEPLAARVQALEARFREIAVTRMAGVPVQNDRLSVQAVGFEPLAGGGALGVLVTPWFMNLVRLPADDEPAPVPGASRTHAVGPERFDFIGAHEEGFGPFEACSLFSPMFEFADHAAALATAAEVLAILRRPPAPAPVPAPAVAAPSRRALLFGRGAESPR